MQPLPDDITAALQRMGLLDGGPPSGERLTGGVSSDIWRVELATGPVCIKRALAKLRVSADWVAPVERNLYEARWMQVAERAVPHASPALLGQDSVSGSLAMRYLPPEQYPLWKHQLRNGHVDAGFAARVGSTLGRIHAATAADPAIEQAFPTDAIFHDLRLDPYLKQVGRVYPDLADRMNRLSQATLGHKHALVHGDVSPKNILCGPEGPVFLDAECAWWGDPAFDLAFCLNHLMLKCLWVPDARHALLRSFDALTAAYFPSVGWESAEALEARAAELLPALFLARVDGKSPVEYVTRDSQRDKVRQVACRLLLDRRDRLVDVVRAWKEEIAA